MRDYYSYRSRTSFRARLRSATYSHKLPRPSYHLRITNAEILIIPPGLTSKPILIPCRVLLNDMRPNGIFAFTSQPITPGQVIQFSIEKPRRFFASGRVIYCHNLILEKKVISNASFPYRTAIEFQFNTVQEEEQVKKYCDELQNVYLKSLAT